MKNIFITLFLAATTAVQAQVSILNTNISTLNILPEFLCQVNIMNGSIGNIQVVLEAKLLNSAGENVLVVKTHPFQLSTGINNGLQLNYTVQSVQYGSSNQSQYIRTTHTLPSGNFKYCVSVVELGGENSDDYCEDLVSDVTSFLSLVYPYDKDTIDTPNPLLTWTHSEPFNILATGEYFRMIVVELSADQSAEAGVATNNPVYYKNYLSTHQQLYPNDAQELKSGNRYGWQVQKISNGTVIDKTESWEFTLTKKTEPTVNKYAVLKKKIDGGFYTVENQKLYFRFNESYISGQITCRIIDDSGKEIKPELKNETNKNDQKEEINVKTNGANLFEIDLKPYRIKTGHYKLEVMNSKKEVFKLKFYVN